MEVLRALSTLSVEVLFQDHIFGDTRKNQREEQTSSIPKLTWVHDEQPSNGNETREEKLFELFTAYAMQTSSDDPTRIRMGNVLKLLHDCSIIRDTVATSAGSHNQSSSSKHQIRLFIRDVEIIASKMLHTSTTCTKLTYDDYLKLLWELALHVYPDIAPGDAFKHLVDQCIHNQPKTKARIRCHVDEAYKETHKVFAFFEPSLLEIFKFYADATHKTTCKHRNKLKAGASVAPLKTKKRTPVSNMASLYLNYHESFAFARKFGLVSHGGVTVSEFAHMYIDSIEKIGNTTRQLTYLGFCHLLLRLALHMYGTNHVSTSMQLKALFQFMWLNSVDVKPNESTKLCGHRDQGSATLHVEGTKLFRTAFLKEWKKDHFIDYAAQIEASGPTIPQRNTAIKQALLEPMGFTYSP